MFLIRKLCSGRLGLSSSSSWRSWSSILYVTLHPIKDVKLAVNLVQHNAKEISNRSPMNEDSTNSLVSSNVSQSMSYPPHDQPAFIRPPCRVVESTVNRVQSIVRPKYQSFEQPSNQSFHRSQYPINPRLFSRPTGQSSFHQSNVCLQYYQPNQPRPRYYHSSNQSQASRQVFPRYNNPLSEHYINPQTKPNRYLSSTPYLRPSSRTYYPPDISGLSIDSSLSQICWDRWTPGLSQDPSSRPNSSVKSLCDSASSYRDRPRTMSPKRSYDSVDDCQQNGDSSSSRETSNERSGRRHDKTMADRRRACEELQRSRVNEYTSYGQLFYACSPSMHTGWTEFSIASYNVLAQYLIAENAYLYPHCKREHLDWDYRKYNLLDEIKKLSPDILCMQEVQEEHYYDFFYPQLVHLGYGGAYKKKTRSRHDGCATFYRLSKFSCETIVPVEYFVPGVDVLDRDNVGILLLLQPLQEIHGSTTPEQGDPHSTDRPSSVRHTTEHNVTRGRKGVIRDIVRNASHQRLCIANTHLLFNPRRGDVKLAQQMLLLAEIDRLSHLDVCSNPLRSVYYPTIICGDFNSEPFSQLYEFMCHGHIDFSDTVIRTMALPRDKADRSDGGYSKSHQSLSNKFLNVRAGITDRCQYVTACVQRIERCDVSDDIKTAVLAQCTGTVVHQFNLISVFDHLKKRDTKNINSDRSKSKSRGVEEDMEKESTTCHNNGNCTVDYIFFSPSLAPPLDSRGEERGSEGEIRGVESSLEQLRLLSLVTVPTVADMAKTGGLPNQTLSSDHVPLLATFALRIN